MEKSIMPKIPEQIIDGVPIIGEKKSNLLTAIYIDNSLRESIKTEKFLNIIELFNPVFYAKSASEENGGKDRFDGINVMVDVVSESAIKCLDGILGNRGQLQYDWVLMINLSEKIIDDNFIKNLHNFITSIRFFDLDEKTHHVSDNANFTAFKHSFQSDFLSNIMDKKDG